ncbi:hypothetical protein P885DRAFT_29394 [Corynascus similis CBS 632.67]
MGGSAFSSYLDPPYTPRMPPAVYRRVVTVCHASLRDIFVCVASPIEGPGKKDYGDVDILVALEKRTVFPTTDDGSTPRSPHELMTVVQRSLGAKHAIIHPAGTSAHLAIQWPSDMDRHYVQVDIRICPSIDELCWILFKHAHGDIWNLLGSTIRPFGLTVDEEALWLRIPEIEKFDRKKSKVFLTKDPVEILHFLGMKVEGFWSEPFKSVDALFDYTTACRLFQVRSTPEGHAQEDANEAGVVGGKEGQKRLKANDRRRMASRPIYRSWVNEFIPQLCAEGKFLSKYPGVSISEMREMVRNEAFARFLVEADYKARLREWQLKKDSEQVKSLIKELVPTTMDPQRRACAVGALKNIIMESDASFGFDLAGLRRADGLYDTDAVRNFVRDHLDEVTRIAWTRQQQRAQEAMRSKAARKAKTAQVIQGIDM